MSNKTSCMHAKSPESPLGSGKKEPKNDSMLNAFVYDTASLQDRLVQRAIAEDKAHTNRDSRKSLSKKEARKATRSSFDEPRLAELRAKLEELDTVISGGDSKGSGSGTVSRGRGHKAQRVSESDAFECQPNSRTALQDLSRSKSDARAEDTQGKEGRRRRKTY